MYLYGLSTKISASKKLNKVILYKSATPIKLISSSKVWYIKKIPLVKMGFIIIITFLLRRNDRNRLNIYRLAISYCRGFFQAFTHGRMRMYCIQYFVGGGFQFTGNHCFGNHFGYVHTNHVAT